MGQLSVIRQRVIFVLLNLKRKDCFFILNYSTYDGIEKIIKKGLPRELYLPRYIAVRVGHKVYVNLFPHKRFQCQRRLINEESVRMLPAELYDFVLSLLSFAKGKENYIKLRGKYLTIDDIANDFRRMNYTKSQVNRYMKKLLECGYIDEVIDDGYTKYKFTSKTILPDKPEELFKVITEESEVMECA